MSAVADSESPWSVSNFQTNGIVEGTTFGVVDVLGLAVEVARESVSFLEESGVPESIIVLPTATMVGLASREGLPILWPPTLGVSVTTLGVSVTLVG